MSKKDKQPHTEVVLTPKGLRPHTSLDAEQMAYMAQGTVFELVPVNARRPKQLRTYWKALGLVVKSTGKWPSAEKLHRDIKFTLGYRELIADLMTGEVHEVVDSVAMDKMDQKTFQTFMNQAMELLTEKVGFDPLAFLNEGE